MAADGTLKFDTKVDESGLSSGASKLGDVAKNALGVFGGNLMTQAFNGLVNLGKSAISAGADMVMAFGEVEQSIGGIETLFGAQGAKSVEEYAQLVGKSVDEVGGEFDTLMKAQTLALDNADKAYMTAGLSANDYMQTVTGFAASLKQSVSDEYEAAQVADMAVVDMSDNANKMGTSMESIQNAYQGFAKQNYTMLDNLKLGYGGTKSEMERLLADAEKITGIHYDIDNLSDVYNAIHVIQGELGITGTTAKEAAGTVQGSIGMAKAAFENLVAGFGSADADIGQLAANLMTSLSTVVTNITPVVERIVAALPEAIGAMLPAISAMLPTLVSTATSIFTTLISTVVSLLPTLIPVAVDALMTIVGALIDNLPLIIDSAVQLVLALVQGIASALPQLIPAAVNAITTIVQGLVDNLPLLLDAALQLILGLAEGLITALPQLIAALPAIIEGIVNFLVEAIPMIIEAGIQLLMALIEAIPVIIQALIDSLPQIIDAIINGLITGMPLIIQGSIQLFMAILQALPQIISALAAALPQIITTIATSLANGIPQIFTAAKECLGMIIEAFPEIVSGVATAVPDIITGIVNGLANGASALWNAALDLGSSILGGIKSFFGINSPSTVMAEQGGYLVQGIMNGLESMPEKMNQILTDALNKVTTWGTDMLNKAGQAMTTILNRIVTIVTQLPGKLWTILVQAVNKIIQWGVTMVSNASTAMSNMLSKIMSWVSQLPGKLWTVLTDCAQKVVSWGSELASKMTEIGSNIVTGIWNGISSGWDWLKDKVSNLAKSLLDAAKDALGIESPSKAFRDEVGKWLMPGAVEGIEKSMPKTLKTVRGNATSLLTEMQEAVSANIGSIGATANLALAGGAGGTVIYQSETFEQTNNYSVPVVTPSETAKANREAFRKMIGGVK